SISADGGPRPHRVPVYSYPESAARALAQAARYREWRDTPMGHVPELGEVDTVAARRLVAGFLATAPDGGWLPAADASALLGCYRIAVDPTRAGGIEVIVEVMQEPVFGPLVVFGLAGAAADVLGDRAARLTPLTDADAEQMIRSLRAAPLLLGQAGSPAVNTGALAELLLRVSRLADDLPEVTELELQPVIAWPDGAVPVSGRVRVLPTMPRDPFLRRLR
ncbi:MAG: acetate--CoA ligase family protein, partial [Actinobacteria bacterium]|nr:acetate--CoA ligase family protein [Actinomycetota bacterium]